MVVFARTHTLVKHNCNTIWKIITLHCSGFLLDIMISLDDFFFWNVVIYFHTMPGLCNECHTVWRDKTIVNWFPLNGATMHKTMKFFLSHFIFLNAFSFKYGRSHFLASFNSNRIDVCLCTCVSIHLIWRIESAFQFDLKFSYFINAQYCYNKRTVNYIKNTLSFDAS